MRCLRDTERAVKLVITFLSLEPTRHMVDQHILMIFKDMLEELYIRDRRGECKEIEEEQGKKGHQDV